MMGRRGVGMRPRLVGAKGNNFSHFSLSYACFPLSYTCFFIILRLFFNYPTPVFSLSYALKNHKKQFLFAHFKEKQYLCTAVDTWGVHIYLVAL